MPSESRYSKIAKLKLAANLSGYQYEVLRHYDKALQDIRNEIEELYKRYAKNGKLTYAEMSKYNRLANLEKYLTEVMTPVFLKNKAIIENMVKVEYEESYYRFAYAINREAGASLTWGLLREADILAATANPMRQLAETRLRVDGMISIRSAITSGLVRGDSFPRMARNIRDVVLATERDSIATRAIRIVRTEGQRAQVMGQQKTYEEARDLGVDVVDTWDATLDSRVRTDHAALDGVPAKYRDGVPYWNTAVGEAAGPLRSGVASFDINCVTGDTWVKASDIQKLYRRWYEGKVLTVRTVSGNEFTVTPNHPVLTDKGWIAANLLTVGCNVISSSGIKELCKGDVDVDYRPSMASEIFNLASIAASAHRVDGSDEQFHGDGMTGEVNIISIDGELRDAIYSTFPEHFSEDAFATAYHNEGMLPIDGNFRRVCVGHGSTSDSSMGRLGKSGAFFGSGVRHSCEHCSASAACLDTVVDEDSSDDLPTDVVFSSEGLFRFSGDVVADNISSIVESDFSGHVYNLQTSSGCYMVSHSPDIVNSAVVHNCRCRITGVIKGYEPQVMRVRDQGVMTRQKYEEFRAEFLRKRREKERR